MSRRAGQRRKPYDPMGSQATRRQPVAANLKGMSFVTDKPNNPIDESPLEPGGSATEPGVGQSDAVPSNSGTEPAIPVAELDASSAQEAAEAVRIEGPVVPSEAEDSSESSQQEVAPEPEAAAPEAETTESSQAAEEKAPEEEVEGKSDEMDWYILKVQSNREDSIRAGLNRRVAIAGLDYFFGDVIVPTEKVTEFKGGKKRVTKRKLYPGYLVVQMEINDDTWFLVRETPGIGDFTGAAGHPTPMLPHEVSRIVAKQEEKQDEAPKLKIAFNSGDRVKITEGTFENFEGEVHTIDQTSGRVTIMINIFGRSTPVELEYWQIESV